jgi:hypothetical protein
VSEYMAQGIHESDQLRSPERICEPDPRTHGFVILEDKWTGKFRRRIIEDQYEAIACFRLNEVVPTDIATHFETAKNLYLYGWFVYRFYPVAEQQALASLEFALRERFSDFVEVEKKKHRRGVGPGLSKLMDHAIKGEFVRNESFSARENWARNRAESRYHFQKSEEMRKAGIDSWVEDESEVVVTNEDLDCDWLGMFKESIPAIRNEYAHGSYMLKSNVRHTFEVVSGIINQLYSQVGKE